MLAEGWYLMSDADVEAELARMRGDDRPSSGALPLSLEEALAYRNRGNLPDEHGRTLRLALPASSIGERRLLYEPDHHDEPNWRVPGSRRVTVIPLGAAERDEPQAWWEEPEVALLEREWAASGSVAGITIPGDYRSFVYKTIIALRHAGKEVTPESLIASMSRWLEPADAERVGDALRAANAGGSRRRAAEVALIGVAAIWGITFVMVKDAVEVIPVMTFLAYRFIPASFLVGIVFARSVRSLDRSGWRWGLVMGVFLTGGYVFQTLGLELTSAANAGFITGMFVVITPLIGSFFGHRPGATGWAAALVASVGLWLLSGSGPGSDPAGDALVLLCAISFSFHIIATDRGVARHDAGGLLVVQLAACGVITLAAAAAAGDLVVPRGSVVWGALAVTALGATALGFFVQTYAQRHTSPSRTALILASEPAFAGLFAFLLAGETLGRAGWIGAGMIMAAIVAVEVVPALRPRRPLPEG